MAITVQLAANPVVAKILTDQDDISNFVNEKLSYVVPGAEHTESFQRGYWNGKSSFFNYQTRTFPAGFLHLITNELVAAGHKVQIAKKPNTIPAGPENPIVDSFGNDDPRYDYQLKALRQVERHGRGIVRVATGGGKTKIAKLIISRYNKMTLFITTRSVLMYQMKSACEEAGMKVGVIGDGMIAPVRGLNVAMVQTLVAKLEEPDLDKEVREVIRKNEASARPLPLSRPQAISIAQKIFNAKTAERNKIIKLLSFMEVVIGEEAHEASGKSYYEILKHCKNANVRVALTATPFMKDSMEDNMRLMAAFGPILIDVSEELLIKRGILATPYFLFAPHTPHPKLRKTSPYQRARQLGIVESEGRNAVIVENCKLAKAHGLTSMVLVGLTKHGDILRDLMSKAGLRVEYIRGENDNDERNRALAKLGSGKIDVLIGTNILDVGVDVPSVGVIIIAGGGKAEVAHRQRIGRGLRFKKKGKNVAFILDFSDDTNTYLRDHSKQRRSIIENTPGFAENIIRGRSFDWSILKE